MTDVAANQRGAKRAGRWASRALLLAGGVLAGTAAAWTFATGASATESPVAPAAPDAPESGTADLTPVTDATVQGLDDLTGGVSELTGDAAGAAAHATEVPSTGTSRAVRQDVTAAVDEFTSEAVVRPVERTLGAFEHIARKPEDAPKVIEQSLAPANQGVQDFGKKFWDFLQPKGEDALAELAPLPLGTGSGTGAADPVVPEQPVTVVPEAGTVGVHTVSVPSPREGSWLAAFDASRVGGSTDEGDAGDRELPSPFSPLRAPLAPLTVPTVPGGGNSAGGHFDGLLAGVPAGSAAAFDTAPIGSVRSGVRHLMVEPGAQPGVTPD
ncbi:hypothetical protein [Amycolatopsis albispora]|uniref:Uncharacterized protein n=1 Tax=Amycolatopsis albispora TaxID=1804986 RepID=A0A344LE11_9PSEU|nr:hypothetical protein [Amycolatopsis albispora]AXB46285.1 hypothetical protein A4R43_30680 [Amycolatopsis albispora]